MENKKKSIKIITVMIIIVIISFSLHTYIKIKEDTKKINEKGSEKKIYLPEESNDDYDLVEDENFNKDDNDDDKNIDDFKKEIISKGLIIKGDIHLENDDYLFALQKYSNANKKTPDNPKILSKIADTYFLMKNYKSAYKYYSKVNSKEFKNKEKIALSIIYKEKIEDFDFSRDDKGDLISPKTKIKIKELKTEIQTIGLEEDSAFYYLNSLECLNNTNNCKINFENYFKNEQYSGENEELEKIRTAIDNYENLKLDESYYKDTLIIGALFENKNYPISIVLSEEILKTKSSYKPILKIISQSYFELNKLEKANKSLIEFSKIDSKSPDVSYMIGVISQKEHNYIKSNIFLNLAIEQGYKNIENIYRLQLYNYLILNQNYKISETFDKIIKLSETLNSNDLILATYYNIINDNIEKANNLTNKGIKLFPEKEDFYGFKAWLKIEENKLEEATELLNKAKEINSDNALVILNLGRISKINFEKEGKSFDKTKAKLLFKKAIELDSAEIGKLADKYIKELDLIKEKEKENIIKDINIDETINIKKM